MYACQDQSSMRFVPLYHTTESCGQVRNGGFKGLDCWPLQGQLASTPFESSSSQSPSRTMYACQDQSSMRFVPLYHTTESCEKVRNEGFKRGLIDARDGGFKVEGRLSMECCSDSTRFTLQYKPIRDTSYTRMLESSDDLALSSPILSAFESSQSESSVQSGISKTRDVDSAVRYKGRSSMKSCTDESSMRFVPLYGAARRQFPSRASESCDEFVTSSPYSSTSKSQSELMKKSGLSKTRDVDSAVRYKGRSSMKPCTDESSMRFVPLYGAVRRQFPSRASESCDEVDTSSPYSSTSKSHSELMKKNSWVVSYSTDSGVFNSSTYGASSLGSPVTPPRTKHEEKMSILIRNESGLDDLNHSVKHEAEDEEVKKTLTSDVVSLLQNLSISDKDSCDERPPTASRKRVARRSRGPSNRGLLSTPSKVPPHSRALKMERPARASATSLVRTSIWDGNYNAVSNNHRLLQSKRPAFKRSCAFCKSNNEPEDLVRSHALKMRDPTTGIFKLTCPVLRKHVCPRCGATGDAAHTYTYCPDTIKEVGYRPISLIAKFKSSAHDSSGRRRTPAPLPYRSSR